MSIEKPGTTIEQEPSQPSYAHDLMTLDGASFARLSERVSKHNGVVWLCVHPIYVYDSHDPEKAIKDKKQQKIQDFVIGQLARPEVNTPPVIFVGEEYSLEYTIKVFNQFAQKQENNFYYFASYDGMATPKKASDPEEENSEVYTKNWGKLPDY